VAKFFVCYSSQDRAQVDGLLAGSASSPHQIWRDIRSLQGGQSWPDEIGKAIEGSDRVLLFWSRNAASSWFVALEYTVAIAHQKMIVPILLDRAPLPPILRATQAIQPSQLAAVLGAPVPEAPAGPTVGPQVARVLGGIKAQGSDEEIARLAIKALRQAGLVRSSHLPLAMVALVCVVAIVALTVIALTVFGGVGPTPTRQIVAGLVVDPRGNPLAGVELLLAEPNATSMSEANGRFELVVLGLVGAEQTLRATKSGFAPLTRTVALGDRSLQLKLSEDSQHLRQRIVGTISEASGRPLVGVRVVLVETGDSTNSSQDGRFEFVVDAPKNAEYTLQATLDGYEPYRFSVFAGNDQIGFKLKRSGR
jgi:hypothetical protein